MSFDDVQWPQLVEICECCLFLGDVVLWDVQF